MWRKSLAHADKCLRIRPAWAKARQRREDATQALQTLTTTTTTTTCNNGSSIGCGGGAKPEGSLGRQFEGLDVSGGGGGAASPLRSPALRRSANTDDKEAGDEAYKRGDYGDAARWYAHWFFYSPSLSLSPPPLFR